MKKKSLIIKIMMGGDDEYCEYCDMPIDKCGCEEEDDEYENEED